MAYLISPFLAFCIALLNTVLCPLTIISFSKIQSGLEAKRELISGKQTDTRIPETAYHIMLQIVVVVQNKITLICHKANNFSFNFLLCFHQGMWLNLKDVRSILLKDQRCCTNLPLFTWTVYFIVCWTAAAVMSGIFFFLFFFFNFSFSFYKIKLWCIYYRILLWDSALLHPYGLCVWLAVFSLYSLYFICVFKGFRPSFKVSGSVCGTHYRTFIYSMYLKLNL